MELRRRKLTPRDIASHALKLQEPLAICAARDKRDRGFESRFLQWRVGEPSVPQRGTFTPSSPYLKRPRLIATEVFGIRSRNRSGGPSRRVRPAQDARD